MDDGTDVIRTPMEFGWKRRMTLALYNTYNRHSFQEPHRRAVARAGALAQAFDLNLALVEFPMPDQVRQPMEFAEWVGETTSIGESGRYLKDMASRDRFHLVHEVKKGFPPQLGLPVATTRLPDERKAISAKDLVDRTEEAQVLLLFGLGPKGLPPKVRDIARYHFDVTSAGFSLETATAMGAVVGLLAGVALSRRR